MSGKKFWLLVLSVFLFFSFILFSYLVAKETFTQIDFDITVKFQDRIPSKLDLLFSYFSVIGLVEITGAIWLVLGLYLVFKKFWQAFLSLGLLPLALSMEIFGKIFVYHPAPPHLFYRGVLDVQFPSHFVHTDYSYPSGHLTRATYLIVFFMIFFHLRSSFRTQLFILPLLFGLLVIMAVSRIYLGEHWTSDVIGGILIGCSFGIISALFVPIRKP